MKKSKSNHEGSFSYFKEEKQLFFRQSKSVRAVFVFLTLSAFLFGLYYEWAAFLAGTVLIFLNLYVIWKNKGVRICKKSVAVIWLLFFLCYFITIIFAVDKGMALVGAVKMLVPALFLFLLLQFDQKQIHYLWHAVPDSGCVMLLLSLILWAIPVTREFVANGGRLGGLFQYSNTFALYLLLGIVVLMQQKSFDLSKKILVIFLAFGILLTGSRFVIVLTAGWFIYQFICVKAYRKDILILSGIIVVAAIIYVLVSGNLSNFGRLFIVGSQTGLSSLIGRLLYWKDAFRIIGKAPMGLGYLGYYYLQPAVQTGDYIVRFVHNDWIQILLDGGLQTFVLLAIGLFLGLKKASKDQKTLFVIIVLAGCFDFHQTYLSIFFLLLMTMNFEDKTFFKKYGVFYAAAGVLLIAFCLLGTSFFLDYFGDYSSACKVFPGNTEARIYLLQETSNLEKAAEQADEIIRRNQYVALAYQAKAVYEKEQGNYREMTQNIDGMLEKSPYRITAYENALDLLSESILEVNQTGDKALFVELAEQALRIPDRINAILRRTDALAWKTDDVPELTLSKDYQLYLSKLNQAMKQLR